MQPDERPLESAMGAGSDCSAIGLFPAPARRRGELRPPRCARAPVRSRLLARCRTARAHVRPRHPRRHRSLLSHALPGASPLASRLSPSPWCFVRMRSWVFEPSSESLPLLRTRRPRQVDVAVGCTLKREESVGEPHVFRGASTITARNDLVLDPLGPSVSPPIPARSRAEA